MIPVSWSDRLPEFFSRLSVEILPEVGHFVPLEAATEVVNEIDRALSEELGS